MSHLLCSTVSLSLQPLDYEKTRSYTLEIQVQNTQTLDTRFLGYLPTKDMATVRIGIEDVDEPPLFERASYVMEVKEDAAMGTAVGSVRAMDPDGYNSPVRLVRALLCFPSSPPTNFYLPPTGNGLVIVICIMGNLMDVKGYVTVVLEL